MRHLILDFLRLRCIFINSLAGYLIESGKAMISTSTPTMDTETQTIKDEAPRVEACAFATYIHPYLCGCLLLEMLRE